MFITVYDDIDIYKKQVAKYPIPSPEEEYEIAVRYYNEGKREDAEKLILCNLRFVFQIAAKYVSYAHSFSDLLQEGSIGLMKAVKKFNPHKGVRFLTYARWWILHQLQEFFLKTRSIINASPTYFKRRLFNTTSKVEELPEKEVREFSLEASPNALVSMFVSEGVTPEEHFMEHENEKDRYRGLHRAIKSLSPKEQTVITECVLLENKSLTEVGKEMGVSRERARQIKEEALTKLRKKLKEFA